LVERCVQSRDKIQRQDRVFFRRVESSASEKERNSQQETNRKTKQKKPIT